MKKKNVYVVTHKPFDDKFIKNDSAYSVIKVGNKLEDSFVEKKKWLNDSSGENISSKNPYYCETTAQYWAWKNVEDVEISGLCHYRRFFLDPFEKKSVHILRRESIEKILAKNEVILLHPTVKSIDAIIPKKNIPLSIQEENFSVIREILLNDYPECVEAYDSMIYGKKMIWRNMFITHKELFDRYSAFLFDVLSKYDKKMAEKSYVRKPRIDGFEAEYLLPTWFLTYCKNIFFAECIDPKDIGVTSFFRRKLLFNDHTVYNLTFRLKERIRKLKDRGR